MITDIEPKFNIVFVIIHRFEVIEMAFENSDQNNLTEYVVNNIQSHCKALLRSTSVLFSFSQNIVDFVFPIRITHSSLIHWIARYISRFDQPYWQTLLKVECEKWLIMTHVNIVNNLSLNWFLILTLVNYYILFFHVNSTAKNNLVFLCSTHFLQRHSITCP